MKPKTEEFLNTLLWTAECLFHPTFRNLTESYESWAYQNSLLRQTASLADRGLLEDKSNESGDRLYRLTAKGRLHALGGRDPELQWTRRWDGKWRMILFDVPMNESSHRSRLRRHLVSRHFGCLQGSVWVTPDPMNEEKNLLREGGIDVNSLLLLEAHPCAGESDEEIVSGAWNFDSINEIYSQHMDLLARYDSRRLRTTADADRLQGWAILERDAWQAAMEADPLLPTTLLPSNYLGKEAWERRKSVMKSAARRMREFRP